MKQKSLSTLGYIMEQLNLPTVYMAQSVHVDASLVSKWKTGSRTLSSRSVYFDDIIQCLMAEGDKSEYRLLKRALSDLFPQETIHDAQQMETLLREALVRKTSHDSSTEHNRLLDTASIPVSVYEGNAGRRDAMNRLLDYAEAMTVPGEFIFLDMGNYSWLLEDPVYYTQFTDRILTLLHRGFHAKFIIHYASCNGYFTQLFHACSSLIFNRNMEWLCYRYYDEQIIQSSFFLLNRAVSLLGLSTGNTDCTTMIFTEHAQVIHHEMYVRQVLQKCTNLFSNYPPDKLDDMLDFSIRFHMHGPMYAFLPAPVFIFSKKELLQEILEYNQIPDQKIRSYLDLNTRLKKQIYDVESAVPHEPFIYLFQMEKMVQRASTAPFISQSLSLLEGKTIQITKQQYARMLTDLADDVIRYPHIQLYLVSEKDNIPIPSINCWCKKNCWMVQMDKHGLRLSEELSMVEAAASTLFQCIRQLPPQRRERKYIFGFLLNLIEELEKSE